MSFNVTGLATGDRQTKYAILNAPSGERYALPVFKIEDNNHFYGPDRDIFAPDRRVRITVDKSS
jgi:hypothetical protein